MKYVNSYNMTGVSFDFLRQVCEFSRCCSSTQQVVVARKHWFFGEIYMIFKSSHWDHKFSNVCLVPCYGMLLVQNIFRPFNGNSVGSRSGWRNISWGKYGSCGFFYPIRQKLDEREISKGLHFECGCYLCAEKCFLQKSSS